MVDRLGILGSRQRTMIRRPFDKTSASSPAAFDLLGAGGNLLHGPGLLKIDEPDVIERVREGTRAFTHDLDLADLYPSLDELGKRGVEVRDDQLCRPSSEPGPISGGIPSPTTIEQPDPGGVSCTTRFPSLTSVSWSTLKPTCSASKPLARSTSETGTITTSKRPVHDAISSSLHRRARGHALQQVAGCEFNAIGISQGASRRAARTRDEVPALRAVPAHERLGARSGRQGPCGAERRTSASTRSPCPSASPRSGLRWSWR